jgi:carboxymethylenebutenolidase
VVASFGGRDRVFKKEARRLQACLQNAGVEHDFEIYPSAGHSFMTADLEGWMGAAAPYTPLRVGYDPQAAEDAWRRMLAFFRRFV